MALDPLQHGALRHADQNEALHFGNSTKIKLKGVNFLHALIKTSK